MTSLCTALVALALTQADAKPEPIDASAFKDKLAVLADGKGHYVAYRTDEPGSFELYSSGDGKTFVKARVVAGGRDGDRQWEYTLWDPRMFHGNGLGSSIYMHTEPAADGGVGAKSYAVRCASKVTSVTLLSPAETKKLLDAARFTGPSWLRIPEVLLRDENGTYYLVDRFRSDDPSVRRDFRVFVGPKGGMKQQPLKDIVDDQAGMIFTTKSGNLRLITGRDGKFEPKWVQGKETTTLIELDLQRYDTARMVYLDLGPYANERLGVPCDDFR